MTLDRFTASYIEAALWSSMDESTPAGGEPMDAPATAICGKKTVALQKAD